MNFVREAWHILEPGKDYVHGWHIDFVCEHLEAITTGRFLRMGLPNRLLINVPPGTMKSLLVNVLWPAWEWGPCDLPSLRYLTTSYSEKYVKRDSRRMRDLVTSEWYQARWGETVRLTRLGEASFANSATGTREGVPFKSLTGGRGDRVIIDDPHSTETAESDADRETTTRIFRESVPLRVNDAVTSAIVVIMQRLHAKDVSGVALDLKLGYIHIRLPMEFEQESRCVTPLDEDPRIYEGELLFPERFPRDTVERDKVPLGSFGVAGQFQQRPSPRAGGLFKRFWFDGRIVKAPPLHTVMVRHWDLAATKSKRASRTAGVKLGRTRDGRYVVVNVVKTQDEGHAVERLIRATAEMDGKDVVISLPQDPGQAGKVQAAALIKMLAGWQVYAAPETGDKVTRALPFAVQCEAGNVDLVEGGWIEAYLDELGDFPSGNFKDQVDASSGAFARLLDGSTYDSSYSWVG